MFQLPSIAKQLGYACVGSVPIFACMGPVCKCNTDIRLTGLLSRCRVGDAQQEPRGKLRLQLCFVMLLYIWKASSQYDCKFVPMSSQ